MYCITRRACLWWCYWPIRMRDGHAAAFSWGHDVHDNKARFKMIENRPGAAPPDGFFCPGRRRAMKATDISRDFSAPGDRRKMRERRAGRYDGEFSLTRFEIASVLLSRCTASGIAFMTLKPAIDWPLPRAAMMGFIKGACRWCPSALRNSRQWGRRFATGAHCQSAIIGPCLWDTKESACYALSSAAASAAPCFFFTISRIFMIYAIYGHATILGWWWYYCEYMLLRFHADDLFLPTSRLLPWFSFKKYAIISHTIWSRHSLLYHTLTPDCDKYAKRAK